MPPQRNERVTTLAALAFVLGAALWLHRSALTAPFFTDDYLFLDQVRNHSLLSVLTGRDPIGNFFRPVGRQFHFWWAARVAHESPVVFHAVNLALFLAALALLWELARRLSGPRAGLIAAAALALHYAADVPILWASGSQDLIALVGALAALVLQAAGRRAWAAMALLLALLSKETVVMTPLVALLIERRGAPDWRTAARRVLPLGLAVVLWGVLWALTAARGGAARSGIELHPAGLAAALVHLGQVGLGLEWGQGGPRSALGALPPLVPLAAVIAAVWWGVAWPVPPVRAGTPGGKREPRAAAKRSRPAQARPAGAARPRRPAWGGVGTLGLAWAALGALPVIAVASAWSAYYYLFALSGFALAFASWAARRSRWVALVAIALLSWTSSGARSLQEFATVPGLWTTQSHVNRFYVERAMKRVSTYVRELRRLRPTLPHGSTVFFSGLPSWIGLQTADGPVVRWVYRDSSLRSYFLTTFSAERANRGPVFFFRGVPSDSLYDETGQAAVWSSIGLSMVLDDHLETARDAFVHHLELKPGDRAIHYWLAWVRYALGDTADAAANLKQAGMVPARGPVPEIALAAEHAVVRDTIGAVRVLMAGIIRHPFDPRAQEMIADLAIGQRGIENTGRIAAFAARVLEPRNPLAWRRWAWVQIETTHYAAAKRSLDRYFELGGVAAQTDLLAARWLDTLHRILPGGDLAQQGLSGDVRARLPAGR